MSNWRCEFVADSISCTLHRLRMAWRTKEIPCRWPYIVLYLLFVAQISQALTCDEEGHKPKKVENNWFTTVFCRPQMKLPCSRVHVIDTSSYSKIWNSLTCLQKWCNILSFFFFIICLRKMFYYTFAYPTSLCCRSLAAVLDLKGKHIVYIKTSVGAAPAVSFSNNFYWHILKLLPKCPCISAGSLFLSLCLFG